jgi:hypothetical protein
MPTVDPKSAPVRAIPISTPGTPWLYPYFAQLSAAFRLSYQRVAGSRGTGDGATLVEAVVYILIAALVMMVVLFMLGAARLAGEADQQSEAIGRALRRAAKRDDDAQDSPMGSAAGPRRVKPV